MGVSITGTLGRCRCLSVLFLLSRGALLAQANTTVVANAEDFVYTIRNATQPGVQDTTLLLEPHLLSFHNISVTPLQASNSTDMTFTGRLVIKPEQLNSSALMDTAMRSGLVALPPHLKVYLQDTTAVNLCELLYRQVDTNLVQTSTGMAFALLPRRPDVQSHTYTRVTLYLRHADMMQALYLYGMATRSPFLEVRQQLGPLFAYNINAQSDVNVSYVTRYSVMYRMWRTPQFIAQDLLLKSIDDPDDPLLNSMRAAGTLMPPQLCNGTLIPEALLHEVNPVGALWIADASRPIATVLQEAWLLACSPRTFWRGPPAVLINEALSLTAAPTGDPASSVRPASRLPPLNASLILMGAINDDPSHLVASVLHLSFMSSLMPLSPTGQIFIQHLTLTGLASQPLPSLQGSTQPAATPPISSALPLAIFNFTDISLLTSPVVWMHNVTLQLPVDDYQALAALAAYGNNPGCQDAGVTARAAQLQQGITSFSLGSLTAAPNTVLLNSFVGWGLNATQLWITPVQPTGLPTCTVGSTSNQLRKKQIVTAAAAASACAVLLLLLGLAGWLIWKRRCQQHSRYQMPKAVAAPHSMLYMAVAKAHESQVAGMPLSQSSEQQSHSRHTAEAQAGGVFLVDLLKDEHHTDTAHSAAQSRAGSFIAAGTTPEADEQTQQGQQTWPDMAGMVKQLSKKMNSTADQLPAVSALQLPSLSSHGCLRHDASVWKGLPVAVKTLVFESDAPATHDTAGTQEAQSKQARAIMEAAIAASLGHRNVVCTYRYDIKAIQPHHVDTAEQAGSLKVVVLNDEPEEACRAYKLYLVQELCDVSLGDVLERGGLLHDPDSGKVDFPSLIAVLMDIAEGLVYLHSKNVVHGDLKPDNVLLKLEPGKEGSGVIAKLADFGLSTHMGHAATHVSGFAGGTPFYVAPEVVLQHRVSTASDVYSFGVMMWQLCTGESPYLTAGGLMVWNPDFTVYQPPNIPPVRYQRLMAQCISRSPSGRPTAAQLVQALHACQPSSLQTVTRDGSGTPGFTQHSSLDIK